MNRYPRWKVGLLIAVLLFCGIYALPNLYPDASAVQISSSDAGGTVPESVVHHVVDVLKKADKKLAAEAAAAAKTKTEEDDIKAVNLTPVRTLQKDKTWLLVFDSNDAQLRAKTIIENTLGKQYVSALNLMSTTPEWLRAIGAKPMNLGLDLRGGMHFLLQVDVEAAVKQRMDGYSGEVKQMLRDAGIQYQGVTIGDKSLTIAFVNDEAKSQADTLFRRKLREFQITNAFDKEHGILLTLSKQTLEQIQDYAVDQNRTALNKRVNELGVSNAVVRRQGANRIVVELPGVQNATQARRLLGKTATLQFRLVAQNVDPARVATGIAPPGTEIFPFKDTERKVVLKRQKIATGSQVTNAKMGFDQQSGQPEVDINLDSAGARRMQRVTSNHVGDPMAVLFIETKTEKKTVIGEDGKPKIEYDSHKVARVINVATIRDTLGSRFRITGLDSAAEASELALLLRAGSLAAPVVVVGETTIGPSLGAANVQAGLVSMVAGLILVLLFMSIYYKLAGLVACVVLTGNVIVLIGVMSLVPGATLTLPGIAGIVLTMGMAVDANVLIYEQIRRYVREGMKPVRALEKGYERAFVTIVDANVTTLIAAIVLLALGSGPVQGFAVTLIIGIGASMFTAIVGSRAILETIYMRPGRAQPKRLSI